MKPPPLKLKPLITAVLVLASFLAGITVGVFIVERAHRQSERMVTYR